MMSEPNSNVYLRAQLPTYICAIVTILYLLFLLSVVVFAFRSNLFMPSAADFIFPHEQKCPPVWRMNSKAWKGQFSWIIIPAEVLADKLILCDKVAMRTS